MNKDIQHLLDIWPTTPNRDFVDILLSGGWEPLSPTSIKRTFYKDNVVCKFDNDGTIGLSSHTGCEYLQWRKAKFHKKKYLTPVIAYRNGLLFQRKLDRVCNGINCYCNDDVVGIARKLRICDWYNHGYLNGKLKFFDTDSIGSGWWNWKVRRAEKQ